MLNSLVCGTSNLPEEHDIEELLSPCSKSTPKKNKRSKISKNPYANRGLDKFNALLDELESKKQKIYTQKGSQDISFVRFVYSSSNDWKPIVVKAKERKLKVQDEVKNNSSNIAAANSEEKVEKVVEESKGEIVKQRNQKQSRKSRWVFKIGDLIQPDWYMPVMIILVLWFLIIYGKTFAILCSSLGWYLVPMIKDTYSNSASNSNSKNSNSNSNSNSILRWNSSLDNPKRKKDYGRKLSERIISAKDSTSPKSVLSGPITEGNSQFRHTHRKSWS